ncbi:hypothetical protein ES705_47247 [subsurface metagenome]
MKGSGWSLQNHGTLTSRAPFFYSLRPGNESWQIGMTLMALFVADYQVRQRTKMKPTLIDLVAFGILCLLGEQGRYWDYYETDPEWWQLRLWTRRN